MPKDEMMHPEDPYRERSFGKEPRVGQSGKPYSGGNAHGVHQKPTRPPEPGSKSGKAPMAGPFKKA